MALLTLTPCPEPDPEDPSTRPPPDLCPPPALSPDGPRLDENGCPGNWTLPEGSEQTLRCQAWGNPSPQLRCHRMSDNTSLPIGDVGPVKRELEGIYLCRAVSSRGEVTREVSVTILCEYQCGQRAGLGGDGGQ